MKKRILLVTMFKNESVGVLRMLKSYYQYIDYYIFQDNGSTDGTNEIVEKFFKEKNIPGFVYKVEEGWKGFGWNRDHLFKTCTKFKSKHNCDWILSTDCDEVLKIVKNEELDFSQLNDTSIEGFEVVAQTNNYLYWRLRFHNTKFNWRFNHDVAHETAYIENKKELDSLSPFNTNFIQVTSSDGESYTDKYKYYKDALNFEDQLIINETVKDDLYHLFYLGNSYADAADIDFQLGNEYNIEMSNRAIFYYKQYIKLFENKKGVTNTINFEDIYRALVTIGVIYKSLEKYDRAKEYLLKATSSDINNYANDALVYLAEIYEVTGEYSEMKNITEILINETRINPIKQLTLINNNFYIDTGDYCTELHNRALDLMKDSIQTDIIKDVNIVSIRNRYWVVDDFYDDPFKIREYALNCSYTKDERFYKGTRSDKRMFVSDTKEKFESIINKKIYNWYEYNINGKFQWCVPKEDKLVYHHDEQQWGGLIYLTPDAPFDSGTSIWAHKETGLRDARENNIDIAFKEGFHNREPFEETDRIGNVFNRLVIFDSKCIHSATNYFGTGIDDGRLAQIFFFDAE